MPEDTKARYQWLQKLSLDGSDSRLEDQAAVMSAYDTRQERAKAGDAYHEGEWCLVHPGNVGGRIRSLVVHPVNPRIMYAGAASGGVWRSDCGGSCWYSVMGNFRDRPQDYSGFGVRGIGALAIDPANPDTVYAGTGEPYVRLFYPGIGGLLKTTDGGLSWEIIGPTEMTSSAAILVDPKDSQMLYCAADKGLFRSSNAGKSWNTLTFGDITDVKLNGDHDLFIGVYGQGAFRRHGKRWKRFGPSLLEVGHRVLIDFGTCPDCRSESAYIRADSAIYRRCAGSRRWVKLDDVDLQQGAPAWASLLAAHPLRPGQFFAGGVNLYSFIGGCRKQRGDGKMSDFDVCRLPLAGSVASESPREQVVDQHQVAFHPEEPDVYYVANDAGVFMTCDDGKSWKKMNYGLAVTQFYDLAVSPHDHEWVVGATQDLGTWMSYGQEWKKILPDDGGEAAFDPINPGVVWCQIQKNGVYIYEICEDDHDPWVTGLTKEEAPFVGKLVAIASERKTKTLLFTGRQHVFRDEVDWRQTRRDTAKWKKISPWVGGLVTAIAVGPEDRSLFVGSSEGDIWWSQVAGAYAEPQNWRQLTAIGQLNRNGRDLPPRLITRIVADPASTQGQPAFYVCYGGVASEASDPGGHVFRCFLDDDKWKWKSRSGGLLNVAVYGLVIDGRDSQTMYLCSDVGVYRSKNRGRHWARFSEELPVVPCFDIHLDQESHGADKGLLRVATHGRGLFQREV